MSIDKKEDEDLMSNNPLLRKIAQLRLAADKNNEESAMEDPQKSDLDLLRDDIIARTIARQPGAKREDILRGIIEMGF